jgi:hypothetical protein
VTDDRIVATDPAPPADSRARGSADVGQVKAAGLVVLALAVIGCLLGPVWNWWSPPGPLGVRVPGGVVTVESEAFIAADGRFALLTCLVGIAAALVLWAVRSVRGPWIVFALAVGGLVGALLTEYIGHLIRGGSTDVRVDTAIAHVPLQVHATGFLFVEALAGALLYGMLVAFTAHDDLGRPDPNRDVRRPAQVATPAGQPVPSSVPAADHPQHGWRDGDATGALQQREFPAQ